MNTIQVMIVILCMIFSSAVIQAGSFDWTKDLNVQASADRNGYKLELSKRFQIDGATVDLVLRRVNDMSDAYMVLRMGEMSNQPVDYVMTRYEANKHRGWGSIAKSLGIKPGSKEFHQLKRGHDLNSYDQRFSYSDSNTNNGKGKSKNRGKGNSNGKGKGKGK